MFKLIVLFAIAYVALAAEQVAEPEKTAAQEPTSGAALPFPGYKPFSPYPGYPYQRAIVDPYFAPFQYQFGQAGYPYYSQSAYPGYSGYWRNQRAGFSYPYAQLPYTAVPGVQHAQVVGPVPSGIYNPAFVPTNAARTPTKA